MTGGRMGGCKRFHSEICQPVSRDAGQDGRPQHDVSVMIQGDGDGVKGSVMGDSASRCCVPTSSFVMAGSCSSPPLTPRSGCFVGMTEYRVELLKLGYTK